MCGVVEEEEGGIVVVGTVVEWWLSLAFELELELLRRELRLSRSVIST